MRMTREVVDHVAWLARLGLSPEERERMREELGSILDYVDTLGRLDLSKVPPSAQITSSENVSRSDGIEQSLSTSEALANAPDRADDFFRIPPVFEDE